MQILLQTHLSHADHPGPAMLANPHLLANPIVPRQGTIYPGWAFFGHKPISPWGMSFIIVYRLRSVFSNMFIEILNLQRCEFAVR